MARNQPEFPEPGELKRKARKLREENTIDEQVEDSFPASDPPSYAGGPHRAGAPGNPQKSAQKKQKKKG